MKQSLKCIVEDHFNLRILDYKEEPCCIYKYEPDYKLSIIIWSGFLPDEEVIKSYQYIGLFCREHHYPVVRSVTDISKSEGSFDGSNKWLAKEYMPVMVKHGFKYTAVVKPDDFFAALALQAQMEITKDLFLTKLFDTYGEAYDWVIGMPE